MMKMYFFNKVNLYLFFIFLFNTHIVCASLLQENDLNSKNYTEVHIWKHKSIGGRNAGHAALRIMENDVQSLYVSFFPDPSASPLEIAKGRVPSVWHTLEQDEKILGSEEKRDIVRLYSLNRETMRNSFNKNKKRYEQMYVLPGNGADSPFSDDSYSRNCSSTVRDVLNFGGMKELFQYQSNSILSAPRIVPIVGEKVIGVGLGIGGGIIGGVGGFLYGAFSWSNPLKTASKGAGTLARGFSEFPLDWSSRHLSVMNYGHKCGECQIVWPADILILAKDARIEEKKKYPLVNSWK